MKKISCGILIVRNTRGVDELLMGHITGHERWDILKGCKDDDEDHISAAIREMREESGFVCQPTELLDLGLFKYNPKKDLYLFKYSGTQEFCHTKAYCDSMFFHQELQKELPELDDFKYVPFDDVLNHCTNGFKEVFQKLRREKIL
jgi:putative (di)nucleoside polyphosphate hydrolase